ncbi:MAG: N-acetylneuraminate synthase [Armatimonadota bacterium]
MQAVMIGDRRVGHGEPVYVVAEAGVNHNGDIEMAKKMIAAAADAGADAVKFQTWRTEAIISRDAPKAEYQKSDAGDHETMFEMEKALELPPEAFAELKRDTEDAGLIFLSSPFDEPSVDVLAELDVAAFKVPSGELTNLSLLRHIARKGRPMIISTGMTTLGEVESAVEAVTSEQNEQIVLLHCTSCYPTALSDCNLRAMPTLRVAFGRPVGYSDHTEGVTAAVAAVALGACMIEKHFTLDKALPGPDHKASLEPDELGDLVRSIRDCETALGSASKGPTAAEADVKAAARKSIVAARAIPAGTRITADMLALKRPGTGLKPDALELVIGQVAAQDIAEDALLEWGMLGARE